MADLLDRNNQHLLLEKADNTNNSFIANINKLAAKLDIVIEAVGLFDENVIPILEEIAELDLDAAIKDLEKGSYLGNRKIDINLLYNMTDIDADTDEVIAIEAWTDPTKTVMYSGATALFKDGITIYIPFMFDENPVNISTHADLLLQLNTNQEFLEKLDNTLIASFAHPVVGEILRIYDVDGVASNLDRLTLHAKTGSFKEANTDYYWTKSTSALQTLAMRVGDIGMIGNNIESFIALANNVIQLVDLQERIPELVDTYTDGVPNKDTTLYNNLSKLIALHTNLDALQVLHTNLNKIISVKDNINAIQEVSDNIVPNLTAILSSYTHAVEAKNAANTAKEYKDSASTSAATALAKANEIKSVTVGSTTTAVAGSNASVVYDTNSGKFHFVIPQGKKGDKGDAFTINARGTTEQRSLYDNEVAGFSFFDLNTSQLYLKLTNDSGNWSDGIQFGKGDPGEDGAAGVGVSSITFASTTDSSGNPGQPDAVDTYSINYTDGSSTTFTVANGNSFNLPDSTSKVYVSKQGNDLNNGLSIENPKATITSAITAANALLANNPRAVVEVMDASRYQEDITIPQNIVVRGSDATLEGTVTLNNNSYFDMYAHYAKVPDSVMVSKVGNSHSYYKVVIQDAGGTLGSLTGCTNLSSNAASGTLFAQIELQKVTHVGIKEETTTGVGHIHVYIKGMYLTADNAIGIYGVGTASDIVGIVEHILMGGSLSNTRGIVFDSANGSLNITSSKIAATTAYDVTSGKVKLSCPDITGITNGNASVVLTPDNLSDSLDLDSSTTPASSKAVKTVNDKLSTPTTTNSLGIMQVGRGLSVSNGIVSVTPQVGYCYTAGEDPNKVVGIPGFVLTQKATIIVAFTKNNTAANPTLNVSGTGAKPLKWPGKDMETDPYFLSYRLQFEYGGDAWFAVGVPKEYATNEPTPNTIMRRDEAGRVRVRTPDHAQDAANKWYVDDKKVDKTTQVVAGTGLSGGGDLSTNRTLSVKYGTTAGTAAQGNDSRIVNSVQTNGNQTVGGVKTFQDQIISKKDITAGQDSGSVALTVNDSQGNANVTFNHAGGIPDSNGSSARITAWVDGPNAKMDFQLKSNTVKGTSQTLTTVMSLTENVVEINKPLIVPTPTADYHAANKKYVDDSLIPVENATSAAISNTLMRRDEAGRVRVGLPGHENDAASKRYVDNIALGVGQSWQNVTGSRAMDVTYTNTTGRTIVVAAGDYQDSGFSHLRLKVGGVLVSATGNGGDVAGDKSGWVSGIVPAGSTYAVLRSGFGKDFSWWSELR